MARKKRAWNMSNPLYRYLQSKKSRSRNAVAGETMARKRFSRTRRVARRAYNAIGGSSVFSGVLPSFIYGAVRPSAVNMASPLLNKIPAGQYSDNIGMALAGWGLAKWGNPMLKTAGKTVLNSEAFIVGMEVGSPLISGLTSGMTTSGTSSTFAYG